MAFWKSIISAMTTLAMIVSPITPYSAQANQCAAAGATGSSTGVSGTVNTYFPGTASAAINATSITVGASSGAVSGIAVGDLLLVIQMQDATISTAESSGYGDGVTTDTFANGYTAINSAGLYEYVRATSSISAAGGTVSIRGEGGGIGLVNAYRFRAGTDTLTARRFQVIRVPQYTNASVSGLVTAAPWDGTRGGVVSIDVAGTLTMAGGEFNADGRGFRGGGAITSTSGSGANTLYRTPVGTGSPNAANGAKGEGIAGTPRYLNNNGVFLDNLVEGLTDGSRARGAPANGGGGGTDGNPVTNDQNTGGGGGGNGGRGGKGGDAWCSNWASGTCVTTGGHPGSRVAQLGVARLTMGGGGGECTPTVSKSFTPGLIGAGSNAVLSVAVTNNNPTLPLNNMGFVDAYPTGLINALTPGAAKSCTTAASLAAAASGTNYTVSAATINAASTCTYTVNVTASAGSYTNILAAGAISGSYGATNPVSVVSLDPTTAILTASAPLSVTKTSYTLSDGISVSNPKSLPGAVMNYIITVTNPGVAPASNNSIVITDPTALRLDLIASDFGGAGSGPVGFFDGSPTSGLTYSFVSLASTADDVQFSNDSGATWTYVPVPGSDGTDPAVTHIRINPKGTMAAGSSFNVQFRYRVE